MNFEEMEMRWKSWEKAEVHIKSIFKMWCRLFEPHNFSRIDITRIYFSYCEDKDGEGVCVDYELPNSSYHGGFEQETEYIPFSVFKSDNPNEEIGKIYWKKEDEKKKQELENAERMEKATEERDKKEYERHKKKFEGERQ